MDEMEINPEPGKKSLFSINVDDVVIQRIFKRLEDEVIQLRKEVTILNETVADLPSRREINDLNLAMKVLKADQAEFIENCSSQINSFRTEFDSKIKRVEEELKSQVVEAVFSVNNVVRAQNSLIEDKIFELTKPTLEFTEMRAAVSVVKSQHEKLSERLENLALIVSNITGEDDESDDNHFSLTRVILKATESDRERIAAHEAKFEQVNKRIVQAENVMKKIVKSTNATLPTWEKASSYKFESKPRIPPLVAPTSYSDYFEYMMRITPMIQKILNGFYHKILSLSNIIWEKQEEERANVELKQQRDGINIDEVTIHELLSNFEDIKQKAVSKLEFNELKQRIDDIQENSIPKLKLKKLSNDIEILSERLVSKAEVDRRFEELQKNFETLNTQIETRSACISPGATPRLYPNGAPAKTSVTPRGNQAYKLMFGGETQPIQQPRGRSAITRVQVHKTEI